MRVERFELSHKLGLSQSPLPNWATRAEKFWISVLIAAEGFEPSFCSNLERTPYKDAVLPLNYAALPNADVEIRNADLLRK